VPPRKWSPEMKILHIETGLHLYGGAQQVLYLLGGLKAGGGVNILVCPAGSAIGAAAVSSADVVEAPMGGELDPRFLFSLVRVIRERRPDLVHVHSRRGADLWGPIAARLTGTRALLTRRVDNPEPPWLARIKYSPYERVVTISEGIRRVLLSEGLPPERVRCVRSAVDSRPFKGERDREWLRREFGVGPEETAVAVIAQLIERKGHRSLIQAVPGILRKCPRARFLFFGKGPLRGELEQLCREAGLGEKVLFAGFRKDLPRVLPCLDLVVHPAFMEGLGVSLLQASAAGLPIVAGRAGGIPEVVRDGVNGYLVEPGDVSALEESVVKVLLDPGLARRLGHAGQEIVGGEFSLEAMVEGNRRVYREILGLNEAGAP